MAGQPEPIKCVFTEGYEVKMIRCPKCKSVRFQDYACDRCKVLELKETLKTAQATMQHLTELFVRIENCVQ